MEDINEVSPPGFGHTKSGKGDKKGGTAAAFDKARKEGRFKGCLLYTSPSPRDLSSSRMPSSA